MTPVPLLPSTVRPFVPHAALRDELGLPRDRFGVETSSFARTHDGRYLVGVVGRRLAVLFADSGEVAWWVTVPGTDLLSGGVTMMRDDVAALVTDRGLLGVALGSGAAVFRMTDVGPRIMAVRAAPDDPRCLYVGGACNVVRLVDPYTQDQRWDLLATDPTWGDAPDAAVSDLSVSDDGRWLLTVRADACHLWDAYARQPARRFAAPGEFIAVGALVPGGRVFFVTARGRMHLVDLATGDTLAERQLDPGLRAHGPVRVSHDGARIAFVGSDCALHEVVLDGLSPRQCARGTEYLRDVLPDGDGWLTLAYGGRVQRVGARDAEGPPEAALFRGSATTMGFGDDTVVTARWGGGVEIFRPDLRSATAALQGRAVRALSPSGRWALLGDARVELATGAEDVCARGEQVAVDDAGRWVSASNGLVTFGPPAHAWSVPRQGSVRQVSLSPDGERAFVVHAHSKLLVVDRAAGVVAQGALPAVGPLAALDGARLAVWDHRAALTVYDAVAAAVVTKAKAPKRGEGMAFTSFSAHPAAGLLLGGCLDGTAALVDAATGALRARWTVGAGAVRAAAFSADGARVATSAEDAFVRTWDVAALLATPVATARRRRR